MSKHLGVVLLLVLGTLLVYVLQRGYAFLVRGYLDYLTMPEYSYLFVLLPSSALLMIHLIVTGFAPSRPSAANLMASASLFMGSLLFYSLGGLDEVNAVQLYGVSFVFLALSFLLIVFRPSSIGRLVGVLLLALITVPVPLSVISYSSTLFSYLIGRVVAAVMGAEVIEAGNSLFLSVYDAEGARRVFELVHACSGIISVTSVLAIAPIIAYFVMRSPGRLLARAAKVAVIVGAAVGVVFVGNAARVAAVIYYTRHHSYEEALQVFHQYPSLLYSGLAVGVAFFLMGKLAPSPGRGGGRPFSTPTALGVRGRRAVALALVVLALLTLAFSSFAPLITVLPARAGPRALTTLGTLVSTPAEVLFNGTGVEVVDERPVQALTTALGSSSVTLVVLRYNGSTYSGYIEVAESPTRFHGWHVCLTLQGYSILKGWRDSSGDPIINYLLVRKGSNERLLGYAIYSVPFLLGNGTSSAYVRVSLFANVRGEKDVEEASASIRRVLELPVATVGGGGGAGALNRVMLMRDVLLAATLIVVSAVIIDGLVRVFGLGR